MEFLPNQAGILNTIKTVLQGIKNQKKIFYITLFSPIRSIIKNQLFSTKPRLARSGSKTKLDKTQLPPTDPSTGQIHDNYPSIDKIPRLNNSYVEVIGRGYADEKHPNRRLVNENIDDKQQSVNKSRSKIIKGKFAGIWMIFFESICMMRRKRKQRNYHLIFMLIRIQKTSVLISYLIYI